MLNEHYQTEENQQEQLRQLLEGMGVSEEKVMDYEFARRRLMIRFNNIDNKAIRERNMVTRLFHDMLVSYHIVLDQSNTRMISIPVTENIMENWQVTENEIFMDALANVDDLNKPTIETMAGVLKKLGTDMEIDEIDGPTLYVVSNNCNNYGAVVILSDRLMKRAEELIDDDFWIIPSSVHEMILAPASLGQSREELEDMVWTINRTQVAPEEVLCDSVYYYDRARGEIS